MKLFEQHIIKGYWWLPENQEDKVAGVLTYTPGERILLELIGGFKSSSNTFKGFLDGDEREVPIIYGIDSNAKEITLLICHSGFSFNFSSTFPMVRYTAQFLVYDKHILGLDEVCQYTAKVRFPELSYWAPPCVIKQRIDYCKDGENMVSSSFHIPKMDEKAETICSVSCENGIQLSIKRNASFQSGELMLKPDIEQYSYLEIGNPNTGLSISAIFKEIHKFSQFLSLATKRNVQPEVIWLKDPAISQDLREGNRYYPPVYILKPQLQVPNSARIERERFLFRYEDVARQLPEMLKKWMSDTDNLQPIKSHLVDSLVYKPIVGSVDFLQVIQPIEGVWWRFRDDSYRVSNKISNRKQTALNTILTEILDSFNDIPSIMKLDLDIDAVVDSRNYYSHFVDKSKKPKTLDGFDLYKLTKKLRKVLLCLVLDLLGLSHEEISRILSKQND